MCVCFVYVCVVYIMCVYTIYICICINVYKKKMYMDYLDHKVLLFI